MADLTEAQKQSHWRYIIYPRQDTCGKQQAAALISDRFLELRSLFRLTTTTISETKEEQG